MAKKKKAVSKKTKGKGPTYRMRIESQSAKSHRYAIVDTKGNVQALSVEKYESEARCRKGALIFALAAPTFAKGINHVDDIPAKRKPAKKKAPKGRKKSTPKRKPARKVKTPSPVAPASC